MTRLHAYLLAPLLSCVAPAAFAQTLPPLLTPEKVLSARHVELSPYISETVSNGKHIPLAIGSALVPLREDDGTTVILGLTDRGPNVALSESDSPGEADLVIFSAPAFAPALYPFTFQGDKIIDSPSKTFSLHGWKVVSGAPISVLSESGTPFSGLPSSKREEAPLSDNHDPLEPANERISLDSESVTYDPTRKVLWIGEEYRPSLLAIDPHTMRVIGRRAPGSGLPKIAELRARNRGFEGLAYLPNDTLIAALQSPVEQASSRTSESFVRFFILPADISSSTDIKTLALEVPKEAKRSSYKIGELAALNEHQILALETYQDKDSEKHYHLIMLDLTSAQPLSSEEFVSGSSPAKTLTRTIVLNFEDFNFASGKIEGIALLNNNKTILISKDNDFGISIKKEKDRSEVAFKDAPTSFLLLELSSPLGTPSAKQHRK